MYVRTETAKRLIEAGFEDEAQNIPAKAGVVDDNSLVNFLLDRIDELQTRCDGIERVAVKASRHSTVIGGPHMGRDGRKRRPGKEA